MYQERNTVDFENVVDNHVNSESVIPQDKQNGGEKDCQAIPYRTNEANKITGKKT